MASLLLSEKKQKNCQYRIDDQGRANLRKAFPPGYEQISKNNRIPSRDDQNRKRQFAGCLLLSGCHERHKGKSQRVLAIQKSEFGIEQGALRDLLEYTWHKHEQDTEKREVGCNDIQRESAVF
jgi:hypothetical protein